MNKNVLVSIMKLHGDNQVDLADYLELSLSRCNAKINGTGGADFTGDEMRKIKQKYNLTNEDMGKIFFATDVSCEDTE